MNEDRKTTGDITWDAHNGQGMLTIRWDDDSTESIPHDQPIDRGTDPFDVANLFCCCCSEYAIDHDRDWICVSRIDC